MRKLGLVAASVLTLAANPPLEAQAQVTVIDPTAIGHLIAQYNNQITAISNQLTEIQRLESQLTNQAAMLQKLQTDITGPVQQIAGQATGILQQAQGIGYGAQSLSTRFANLYPPTFAAGNNTLANTQASLASWRANNAAAIQAALQMQNSIAQGQPTTSAQVQSAVAASQGAAGQTSAIQATNQLLATVTAQLTQLQSLLITQARAAQLLAAQAAASQATGAADSQRFWTMTAPPSRVQTPGAL
jgi:P-type conjugative transfer protein TrbJ